MATQIQGNGGTILDVDGTTWRSVRTTIRPAEIGALGIYSLAPVTGTMAAGLAANAEVCQFRWTHATNLCAIWEITCDGAGGIGAFTAGFCQVSAWIARSFTAAGTGGATATITGNNNKHKTSYGTTTLGELRIATTAALTAGTKTLDSQAVGRVVSSTTATAGTVLFPPTPLFSALTHYGSGPIILVQNEGVAIQATVPATGTWTGGFTFRWSELTAY